MFEWSSKVSVSPTTENAVTTDVWFVDGNSVGATRLRFVERVPYPNRLDSKDAGAASARGDPASIRT